MIVKSSRRFVKNSSVDVDSHDDGDYDDGTQDWDGTSADSGVGKYGTCCVELDIWEANSISAAYTNHPCEITGEGGGGEGEGSRVTRPRPVQVRGSGVRG